MNSTIVVTTPAAVTALTTIDRMQQELRVTDDDSVLLGPKIDEASSDIAARCAASLRRETVTETIYPGQLRPNSNGDHYSRWQGDLGPNFGHHRGGRGGGALELRRRPVVSIASVILDDVLVPSGEYRIDGETGFLCRLTTDGYPCEWWFGKSLAVAYVAGYLLPGETGFDTDPYPLPPALQGAAVRLVSSFWASRGRDPTLRSEQLDGVASYTYWVGAVGAAGDLPPDVMSAIAPYQRIGLF